MMSGSGSGGGGGGLSERNVLGARARVTKRVGGGVNGALAAAGDGSPGKENSGGVGAAEVEEEEAVAIRREDDFQGWLAQQKAGWKRHREQRRVARRTEARSQVWSCFSFRLVFACAAARRRRRRRR